MNKKFLVTKLAKEVLKRRGFGPSADASGGRCYEFRDELIEELQNNKLKPIAVDNFNWISYAAKLRIKVGYSEEAMLTSVGNEHAWVYVEGKHYDSLTLNGADSPKHLGFYEKNYSRGNYIPDDEEIFYQESKYNKTYDPKKDAFVDINSVPHIKTFHSKIWHELDDKQKKSFLRKNPRVKI